MNLQIYLAEGKMSELPKNEKASDYLSGGWVNVEDLREWLESHEEHNKRWVYNELLASLEKDGEGK